MDHQVSKLQQNFWTFCLVAAPLLIAVAQFYWRDGMLTAQAGVLQVLSFTLWIFAFQAMSHQLKNELPRYALFGFSVAVYACIGGNNFGVDGIYTDAMGLQSLEANSQFLEK